MFTSLNGMLVRGAAELFRMFARQLAGQASHVRSRARVYFKAAMLALLAVAIHFQQYDDAWELAVMNSNEAVVNDLGTARNGGDLQKYALLDIVVVCFNKIIHMLVQDAVVWLGPSVTRGHILTRQPRQAHQQSMSVV